MNKIIDIFFSVMGRQVPADHGYLLFSAISRILESSGNRWLHENQNVGLHLIRGVYDGQRSLLLANGAQMGVRLPVNLLPKTLTLAGKRFELAGHPVRIGVSRSATLRPADTLYARIVTTKNGQDPSRFDAEMQRQLNTLGINGKARRVSLKNRTANSDKDAGRRVFRIGSKTIVGHSVLVTELTAESSIHLQEQGLGGRRRMGCGVFLPTQGGEL